MVFDEYLADRIRNQLSSSVNFTEKKMFGGIAFMVNDKMAVGIIKQELMVRVNPEIQNQLLGINGVRRMDFSGKPMKGFLLVSSECIDSEENLKYWIDLTLEYNPLAKSSKKKK